MSSKPTKLPLGELLELIIDHRGKTPNKLGFEDFFSNGVPVLSAKHVKTDVLVEIGSMRYASKEMYKKWMPVEVQKGDIILTSEAPMGEVFYINDDKKYVLGQRVFGLRPNPRLINPRYLAAWLASSEGQNQIAARASGSTVLGIRQSELLKLEVDVPSDNEQKRIANVRFSLTDKINVNRGINQTLEAMAQAIFRSWFVDFDPVKAKIAAIRDGHDPLRAAMSAISGKSDDEIDVLPQEQFDQLGAIATLFPDEMEESTSGAIPRGWSHKPLAELTAKIGSGATPRGGKEVYLEDGVALIRSQNVYDSLFVWEGLARISDEAAAQLKGVTVQEGDVLLNITGASILRTCVVEPDALPARVNQHVAIIRAIVGIPPRFIHMHLLRPDIKSYLLGLNAGASREAITKAHIESLTLLTPGPELLSAFQAATDPLFRQVQRFAQQMRILGELRDALLPKLLSGELAVTVPTEIAGAA